MKYHKKTRCYTGLTIVEIVVALAIMAIIFAAILPQLALIQNSWASNQSSAEALQNGRVLVSHLSYNLARAVRINAVSDSSETDGYIEFEATNGNNMRYDIAANNYVEFGIVGSLSDLAGPVSKLQFTCYALNDMDTPITDIDSIRFIKVATTLSNSAALGQDKSFTVTASLHTNWVTTTPHETTTGWTMDENLENDGEDGGDVVRLHGMTASWTTNHDGTGNALVFGEDGGHVDGAAQCSTGDYTLSGWLKDTGPASGSGDRSTFYGAGANIWFGVDRGSSASVWLDVGGDTAYTAPGTWTRDVWHHLAATWDGSGVHIYIDGVDMPLTTSGTINDVPSPKNATIGAYKTSKKEGYKDEWVGAMDSILIYDAALAPEEVYSISEDLTTTLEP